jgi:hypothetical protein
LKWLESESRLGPGPVTLIVQTVRRLRNVQKSLMPKSGDSSLKTKYLGPAWLRQPDCDLVKHAEKPVPLESGKKINAETRSQFALAA